MDDISEINDAEAQEMESQDEVMDLGFTKELIDEIREQKSTNPGMFVSAWEEDTEGILSRNESDPLDVFLTSAEDGNLVRVTELLVADPSLIKGRDEDGYTALHRASYNNHLDVVSFLLQNGADAEARTDDGWTPLMSAANWASYDVIARLLSHGVNANAVSNGGVSALHLAVNSQSEETDAILHAVRYLLQAPGIDAGIVSGSGDTPVMMAFRSSKLIYELLQSFLER